MNYKKKPELVEAMQFDGINGMQIMSWSKAKVTFLYSREIADYPKQNSIQITTVYSDQIAKPSDWIVKFPHGSILVLSDSSFKANYEEC